MSNSNNQFRPLEMPKFTLWDYLTLSKKDRELIVYHRKLMNEVMDQQMKAESIKVENCKHEKAIDFYGLIRCKDCGKVMDEVPRVAKAVGKKEHKRLYRIASSMCDTGVYQPKAIYFGCWLVEYKWSWKLNKAVRL